MRESQVEKKAIEAQLRSIRADVSRRGASPTALESFPVQSAPTKQAQRQVIPTQMGNTHPTTPTASTPTRPNSSTQTRSTQTRSTQTQKNHTQHVQTSPPPQQQAALRSPELPPINTTPPYQSQQTHDELAAIVERLQRQSEFYIQQVKQLQPQFAQTPEQYLGRALPVLEAQVQHINQLSAVQEAALLELKTTATKVEQDWKALERRTNSAVPNADCNIPALCNYLEVAVPRVEQDQHGVYVLGSRSIDLFRAEREASLTAQALRHWAERTQPVKEPKQPVIKRFCQWLMRVLLLSDPQSVPDSARVDPPQSPVQSKSPSTHFPSSSRQAKRARRSRSRRSSRFAITLRQGVALFLSAVMVRVVLNLLLTSFPVLWTPAVALLVTPAAIAVYRTSRTPRSGLIWGYRLLIIMLGLLLGGRL